MGSPDAFSDFFSLDSVITEYLSECYAARSVARASELAQRLGVTPSTLTRACEAIAGAPPSKILKERQLAHVELLLTSTKFSLTEIAYRAGFGTRATMFRAFMKKVKCTPHTYRATHREGPESLRRSQKSFDG